MTLALLDISRPPQEAWGLEYSDAYYNGDAGNIFAIGALVIVVACVALWMKGRK